MKKITFLMILLTMSFGYSQTIPVTFDSGVVVSDNWNKDSGLASVAIVDAPVGLVTYGKVGQITSAAPGDGINPWQNAQLKMKTNYIDLTNATGSKIITFDYYSTVAGSLLVKIESAKNGGLPSEKAVAIAGTGWQSISVDFSTPDAGVTPNDQYSLLVFFPCHSPGFANPSFAGVFYIDNISGTVGSVTSDPGPITNAPTPVVNHLTVNSIFSDAPAYFEPCPILYNENWGGSSRTETVTPVSPDNQILKYPSLTYQGIDFSNDIQDVSGKTTLHVDYWTSNGTTLNVTIINTDVVEKLSNISNSITPNTWQSIDIPLSAFPMTLNNVKQLMFTGTGTFYIDNIYFAGGAPSAPKTGTCIKTSTVGVEGNFSVGYKATYETLANGTDVKITYELLDADKSGPVAYLQKETPFTEIPMTYVSGQIWTTTLTGLTPGEALSYRCKFAFEGGLVNTEYNKYEVGADCCTNDVIAPNSFTATVGAITPFSVELLLNSNDASGTVVYNIAYGGNTKRISAPSGVQKSLVISALTGSTMYNFAVSATDLAGNAASNNAIMLSAETGIDTSTACSGTSPLSQQGAFDVGYNYAFETIGQDVKITFELLGSKTVELAYLWRELPSFSETGPMTKTGNIVTSTVTGLETGATISYGVKFIFVGGGAAVTKYFSYVVGNTCSLGVENPSELKQAFYPNPVKNMFYLQLLDEQNRIVLTDMLGRKIMEEVVKASHILDMSVYKTGVYILKVENSHGIQNVKIIKE
jgi:rubredoxin